jgi:DNA-directed RNA polymerase subunit RPC12/RpoP
MICIICGRNLSNLKQKPVPIKALEFRPFIGQSEPGQDNIYGAEACQDCYQKVLANRAKAIAEFGRIEDDTH